MQPARRRAHARLTPLLLSAALGLVGCASPGPPRPPSLGLPRPVTDAKATRSGDEVALRFTLPSLTTDGQPLRDTSLRGSLCRQMGDSGKCVPVDLEATANPLPLSQATSFEPVVWTDRLPPDLLSGVPRPVAYRIELRNSSGRSAGPSDPVYAAAGAAPPQVGQLRADPMRLGIALRWTPLSGAGEVLLDRSAPVSPPKPTGENASPAPDGKHGQGRGRRRERAAPLGPKRPRAAAGTPGLVILQAAPGDNGASYTVDSTAAEGVPYTYSAFRRQVIQLGGRTLELRSALSAPVEATWRDIYPPAVPQGLTALGFRVPGPDGDAGSTERNAFAVDLVWQPVNDPRLAGYRIYRQTLGAGGQPVGTRQPLTAAPVTAPGFHDSTALASESYRYSVTAIDPKGNESAPAVADVAASAAQR